MGDVVHLKGPRGIEMVERTTKGPGPVLHSCCCFLVDDAELIDLAMDLATETPDPGMPLSQLSQKARRLRHRILQTPAKTPAGLRFKLAEWARANQEEDQVLDPVLTAIFDDLAAMTELHDGETSHG
jgi:hypothetical protein